MLIDTAPTILAVLDAPAGIKHTGSVLAEVVGSEASVKSEADEMEEHLRGLGQSGVAGARVVGCASS